MKTYRLMALCAYCGFGEAKSGLFTSPHKTIGTRDCGDEMMCQPAVAVSER